tara:strand:- start:313 stop:852 length:540 start_codon:yes stop_codon:yes gene_type:complete
MHSGVAGWLPHFGNIDKGRCWTCMTKGYLIKRVYTGKQINLIVRAKERRLEKKRAEFELNIELSALRRIAHNQKSYVFKKKFLAEKKVSILNSVYVGNIGERNTFSLVLKFQKRFESFYGDKWLNKFVDHNGNDFVYFGNYVDLEKGEVARIKATIKEHKIYEGVKQTIIQRLKIEKGA